MYCETLLWYKAQELSIQTASRTEASHRNFLGPLFLLFLYTCHAPKIMICTATAMNKNVVMLGFSFPTTILELASDSQYKTRQYLLPAIAKGILVPSAL